MVFEYIIRIFKVLALFGPFSIFPEHFSVYIRYPSLICNIVLLLGEKKYDSRIVSEKISMYLYLEEIYYISIYHCYVFLKRFFARCLAAFYLQMRD